MTDPGDRDAGGAEPPRRREDDPEPGRQDRPGAETRSAGADPPAPEPGTRAEDEQAADGWLLFVRDVGTSVGAVALVGLLLFAVSGVWPPLVAVESGSMLPNMERNDLVFIMEEDRFPGRGAQAGVVTARVGAETGYNRFGNPGDVVVYRPDGQRGTTPIIHRAMFWVEAGENWCRLGDPAYLGQVDPDSDRCVADHAGFVTKGDNNPAYDQAQGISRVVRPEWVVGTAELRVPGLGWLRLQSG